MTQIINLTVKIGGLTAEEKEQLFNFVSVLLICSKPRINLRLNKQPNAAVRSISQVRGGASESSQRWQFLTLTRGC